jgi:hypothetical protein
MQKKGACAEKSLIIFEVSIFIHFLVVVRSQSQTNLGVLLVGNRLVVEYGRRLPWL